MKSSFQKKTYFGKVTLIDATVTYNIEMALKNGSKESDKYIAM